MTAFVRFARSPASPRSRRCTWLVEPEHHIVEATAPFFARPLSRRCAWASLTPERSVEWDGTALRFGPGARKEQAPLADAGERLWLTYSENIFNRPG